MGGTLPLCKTTAVIALQVTGFIRSDISALCIDVTHPNYCAAAVPKQIYFRNSMTGNGCEILVPFSLSGEDRSPLFKAGWAGQQMRPQSEGWCLATLRISLDVFPVGEIDRSRMKSVVKKTKKKSYGIVIRSAVILFLFFFLTTFWCPLSSHIYWIASHFLNRCV